jgi:hypothetical protein
MSRWRKVEALIRREDMIDLRSLGGYERMNECGPTSKGGGGGMSGGAEWSEWKEAEVGGDALFIYYDSWDLCALAWLLNIGRASGGRRQGVFSAFVGVNALLGRRAVGCWRGEGENTNTRTFQAEASVVRAASPKSKKDRIWARDGGRGL